MRSLSLLAVDRTDGDFSLSKSMKTHICAMHAWRRIEPKCSLYCF